MHSWARRPRCHGCTVAQAPAPSESITTPSTAVARPTPGRPSLRRSGSLLGEQRVHLPLLGGGDRGSVANVLEADAPAAVYDVGAVHASHAEGPGQIARGIEEERHVMGTLLQELAGVPLLFVDVD